MKICIPVVESDGLESKLSGHFGSSPFFAICDDVQGTCEIVKNVNEHHAHGMCQPLNQLGGYGLDAVVCGGMGAGAIGKFNAAGIRVYLGHSASVRAALQEFGEHRAPELTPELGCRHHSCGSHERTE